MNRMHSVTRRDFLKSAAILAAPGLAFREAETLYNGIPLGSPWPPDNRYFSADPIEPPYIADPPAVIPIDLGRQLFVDDFLIEESSLARTFHRAEYHAGNPILAPETPWELRDEYADRTRTRPNPTAMPFSDCVFYDDRDRLFKMWYMAGYNMNTCYATSRDGVSWERPKLDIVKGTNILVSGLRDSNTVWLDHENLDRLGRYKMASYNGSDKAMLLYAADDGIHWKRLGQSGTPGDRTTFFWNPFRKVWVYSIRDDVDGKERRRRYFETPKFDAAGWQYRQPSLWIGADKLDRRRTEFNTPPELYNLDCVAYESLLIGLFTIWHGEQKEREKPNDICVGYSRDGFHWSRPDRQAFIGVSEKPGDWNWANVQSAGGCCLVVGDRLYFYVSGRQGEPGTNRPGRCSTGLATLRRDGFASLTDDRRTPQPVRLGTVSKSITTRPVRFSGSHMFVNADVAGSLKVEVLTREGKPLPQYSGANVIPVGGNSTRAAVTWRDRPLLKELAGEPVRFRFTLDRGRLFAFWVSASSSGQSGGYVAGGGPGFTAGIDRA